MTTTNLLLSIPFLLLAATGCTTEEISDTPIPNEKGEYAVNFSGGLDLELTKSDPDKLSNGVKATIAAYKTGQTDAAVASNGYTANGSGDFTGESSYTMYLARGSYDFYAVSCNSITKEAPAFTNGTSSSDLENGVDYIWAKAESQDIENTGKSITLGLAHKAVCIEIIVKTAASTGIELISWESTAGADNDNATIMPPAVTGCKMALSTGVITPATGVSTSPVNMGTEEVQGTSGYANEKTATVSYYILPLAKKDASNSYELPVTFKVKVKIDGHDYSIANTNGESKTYTAKLTAPASGSYAFVAGNKYTYTATLKPNTISFTGATVTAWGDGGSNDSLKPTEPDPAS